MRYFDPSRIEIVLVALVGLLATSARAGERPSAPAGWTDGFVMANGIRIHYWRTGGDRPVLLMAHGSSDDGLCWTNLARELEDEYDIIMPDARGHGLSDPPSKSDSADAQAEDLTGLIRALDLEKPIMMGHRTAWRGQARPQCEQMLFSRNLWVNEISPANC